MKMSQTLIRQHLMLQCIPREPRKIDASSIQDVLDEQGLNISLRTIQRDLIELSRVFPLLSDDRTKPFGWSWQRNADIYDLLQQFNRITLQKMQIFMNCCRSSIN